MKNVLNKQILGKLNQEKGDGIYIQFQNEMGTADIKKNKRVIP